MLYIHQRMGKSRPFVGPFHLDAQRLRDYQDIAKQDGSIHTHIINWHQGNLGSQIGIRHDRTERQHLSELAITG